MSARGSDRPDGRAGHDRAWWSERPALARFLADLIAAELRRLRPGSEIPPTARWTEDLDIGTAGTGAGRGAHERGAHEQGTDRPGEDRLGADSLELLTLATAVTETLHLHRSGIEDYLLVRRRLGDWIDIAAEGLSRFDAALTFRTSGSTGGPKPCTHALALLEEEVGCLVRIVGPVRRIVTLVPSHHIYGFLFTVLLPRALDVSVLDMRGHLPSRVGALLQPGDLLVAVPDLWAGLARSGVAIAAGACGVSSTAPLASDVARTLRERGLGRLIEVYGSSETGGIGWREEPSASFRLFGYWTVEDGDEAMLRRACGQAVPVPDRILPQGDGRFILGGRRDGAVQVGGINVFPDRIAALLRDRPGVAAAAVRAYEVSGGARLKAFIVPAPGVEPAALVRDLSRWAETALPAVERPRSWTTGDALPRGDMGKLADWRSTGTDQTAAGAWPWMD